MTTSGGGVGILRRPCAMKTVREDTLRFAVPCPAWRDLHYEWIVRVTVALVPVAAAEGLVLGSSGQARG